MARRIWYRRQWRYSPRARLFWTTFGGCVHYTRHWTWSYG